MRLQRGYETSKWYVETVVFDVPLYEVYSLVECRMCNFARADYGC